MADMLLYPWIWEDKPSQDIEKYVNEAKPLFLKGSTASSPKERYDYCSDIFDIIKELIPEDEKDLDLAKLHEKLPGAKTHAESSSFPEAVSRQGRTQGVSKRLFADLNNRLRLGAPSDTFFAAQLPVIKTSKKEALTAAASDGRIIIIDGNEFAGSFLHGRIIINEIHPKSNPNLKKAYQNIYAKYSINIRSYIGKFNQLLHSYEPVRDENYLFGNGISSKRLGDIKKRYWYRNVVQEDVPQIALILLIDGSGSMSGDRIKAVMHSTVILHEVLAAHHIEHAVVEHRAGGLNPEIDVSVLVGFNSRREDKYKIMQLDAYNDNRDALALLWAERYLNLMTSAPHKVILVLSDGLPSHAYDDYYPPASVKDTAQTVSKIIKRGTDVVAVSLDAFGELNCYRLLSEIYPNLVSCNDLNRLTGQLLSVISKLLC